MSDHSPADSVRSIDGRGERALHWFFLSGNRTAVAALLVAAVTGTMFVLAWTGLVAVGPESAAARAFSSGLVAGTVTLVTIALSINQLVLSRMFGSPDELSAQMHGTRELRRRVCDHADRAAAPNDPAEFLALTAETLTDRADSLAATFEDADDAPPDAAAYADGIASYGESIAGKVEDGTAIVDVLATIIGTEYARNITATEQFRNANADRLSAAATAELDAIDELLEAVAVTRQFFKTLALQQDFARLSRVVAYSGLVALVVSVTTALLYRGGTTTVPEAVLPHLFSVGFGVVVAPLCLFIAYVFRAATIARRTISVGPFVPPAERADD